MAQEYMLSVSVRLGLEGVCADELRRLGFDGVQAENGRVLCPSDAGGIARANLNLRTGERVLLRLGRFDAPDFDALYQGVRALPWGDFVPRDGAFPVRGRCLDSRLTSEQRCGRRRETPWGQNMAWNICRKAGQSISSAFLCSRT